MEQSRPTPVLDRMYVRGQYERSSTDTTRLAAELAAPQDTARLTVDFDNGYTPVRDVGGMLTVQRTAILEAYLTGTVQNMATTHPAILSGPVSNLHDRVTSGLDDQPVGHNFFVNATGFLDAGLSWARQFDELLQRRLSVSIRDISRTHDMAGKDRVLATLTENPDNELMTSIAVYLAGRSREGERYLQQHYGEVLERAKSNVYATTQRIGATTGLGTDMLERAAGQLRRAAFGSFDHLAAMVTSDNREGTMGDYLSGSLRIEILFDGNVRGARMRSQEDANHIISHEINHAASAQVGGSRIGLKSNGQGLEANEGMTEYLAQLSIGSPGIERFQDGSSRIRQDVPYRVPVFAMFALHEQFKAGKNNHFAVLFNAYHGDVWSQAQLKHALDYFYQHDIAIADQLGS